MFSSMNLSAFLIALTSHSAVGRPPIKPPGSPNDHHRPLGNGDGRSIVFAAGVPGDLEGWKPEAEAVDDE